MAGKGPKKDRAQMPIEAPRVPGTRRGACPALSPVIQSDTILLRRKPRLGKSTGEVGHETKCVRDAKIIFLCHMAHQLINDPYTLVK